MTTTTKTKVKTVTPTEIARMYISRHWNNVMFTRDLWHHYSNGVWNECPDLVQEHHFWNLLEEYENMHQCRPSVNVYNSTMRRCRARLYVREEQVDASHDLINLANGVYNMTDGNLYPHKPEYYMTTQLPFNYDPQAQAEMWNLYILTTFVKPHTTEHDPELAAFVQEAMGYSLTTSVEYHVAFWCYGEGANGKGVLFHVLEELAGNAAVPLNVSLLRYKRDTYQLADLAGKRIALCSEASASDSLVEDAIVKALVGGDTLRARQAYGKGFVLHPVVKLWWAMNKLPAVADTSYGFWRRTRVIPFNRRFKERERILNLKEQLSLELPGIFRWAMEGLKRLNKRGHFDIPSQVRLATEKYKKESNPVAMFVDDECITGQGKEVQSSVIYSGYTEWCKSNGHKRLSQVRFKSEMERLKFFAYRKTAGVFFEGVAMKWP